MWEGPWKNTAFVMALFSFSFGFMAINRTIGVDVLNEAKRQAINMTHCCSYLSNYKYGDDTNFEVIMSHGFSNCGRIWYNHCLLAGGWLRFYCCFHIYHFPSLCTFSIKTDYLICCIHKLKPNFKCTIPVSQAA